MTSPSRPASGKKPAQKPGDSPATATADAAPAGERIAKVLARAGIASRRQAEEMILAGRVEVNGKRIDSPALNVTSAERVLVDGRPLAEPDPPRLWLYHKPTGLVTTARDEKGRQTVFDTLPASLPRVMSIGRLDLNSEGLLLLTNDGALKRRLELPSTGWLRKYRVRVHGRPDDAMLEPLRAGLNLEGERFQPMQVAIDRQQGANAWLTIGIREGRNREIRRALESVGLTVSRLIRIGYGPFRLGDLAPGAISEVKERILRAQLGLEPEAEPAARTGNVQGSGKRREKTPAGRKARQTEGESTATKGVPGKPPTRPGGMGKPPRQGSDGKRFSGRKPPRH
ncbi:MAG: rRNA pseudouridine synthase [Pararhodobacter sp.]|nr:rRNA pseudouridine synthase [Pararhodobacter sp.]